MAEKKDIPWELVGADYQAGVLSLDAIVEKYGRTFSRALMQRQAKRFGWSRDNGERVRVRANEIVDAAEAAGVAGQGVAAGVAAASQLHQRIVVEGAAQAQAVIELKQRGTLASMCEARDMVLEGLKKQVQDPEALYPLIREAIAAANDLGDGNAAKRIVKLATDVLSLPVQIEMLKDLVDLETKIQAMQRKAYRMDQEVGGTGIEELLERLGR